MVELTNTGAFLVNGRDLVPADQDAAKILHSKYNASADAQDARRGTMAHSILTSHNTSKDEQKLKIKFDAMASHDITYVGIIQTARASGLEKFPLPYVLTNCHNSLCAVGGTINEDDHLFGLSAAKKYGGIYVPAHQAVIHQFMREMYSSCGSMILGSDSHTRYGALGTMAVGEGGPELVKQLLGRTYDVDMPEVVCIYLDGKPVPGVGPQDVALAIIGAVFKNGYVKNKIMEFTGPGVANLSMDFRIGVDVMTTETTCLSSIWTTDALTKQYFETHHRPEAYKTLTPAEVAYYDGVVKVDLSKVRPMIAMPFHPSNTYTIEELNANLADILHQVEKIAAEQLAAPNIHYTLSDKIVNGKLKVDQGVIAGCAGGTFENLCDAADILEDASIGSDEFMLSAYPSSQPVNMELVRNGSAAKLMGAGVTLRTAFCGPCFGAGDVPANGAFSIRHSTRNFPNREGSKPGQGQISSVALMDARSIAATAANGGILTPATDLAMDYSKPAYTFDETVYNKRVYNGFGKADVSEELRFGPNIADWPAMPELTEDLVLKVVSEIHDPVTTTDELIPSGETSSYRSNPLKLAEFTLSRKDPEYVEKAKAVQKYEAARLEGKNPAEQDDEMGDAFEKAQALKPSLDPCATGIGSVIFAVKPGDGSAREQAASCQKVLGGLANIANEYATKRYRSNLINWGMLPLQIAEGPLPFESGDYLFLPDIRKAVETKASAIKGYVLKESPIEFTLTLANLTDDERKIILSGCLINFYKKN